MARRQQHLTPQTQSEAPDWTLEFVNAYGQKFLNISPDWTEFHLTMHGHSLKHFDDAYDAWMDKDH